VNKRSRTEAISVQEKRKKDQEHKILSWFTSSRATSSPLPTNKDFH